MDDLLRELAARERKLKKLAKEPPGRGSAACWPAWRMLLLKTSAPRDFDEWWAAHGSACDRCRATHERLIREAQPPVDLPLAAEPSAAYETQIGARIREFLGSLPARVADAEECDRLNACVKMLHEQGRLTADDKARLAGLEWLAADLKRAFAASGKGE